MMLQPEISRRCRVRGNIEYHCGGKDIFKQVTSRCMIGAYTLFEYKSEIRPTSQVLPSTTDET